VISWFIINLGKMNEDDARWEEDCTCVCVCMCVCRAMPQRKFHCVYSKDRLPDLTNDMCRLLSYRSLNGLVRNHRPDGVDGDRDRKWRRDEQERLSTVEVKVGKSSRPSDSHWGHEVIDSWWYAWSYASYARTRDWLFSLPLLDKRVKSSTRRESPLLDAIAKFHVSIGVFEICVNYKNIDETIENKIITNIDKTECDEIHALLS